MLKKLLEDLGLLVTGEMANMIADTACSMINRQDPVFGMRVAPPVIYYGDKFCCVLRPCQVGKNAF